MLIHAGFVANDPFSEEYRYMLALIKDLAAYLKRQSVNLLLETGGESPVTLRRLIEDSGCDNLFVNLDTANLIMYGFGNSVDAVYTLYPYIRSLHIKDGLPPQDVKNLGRETEFGEGFVDFKRTFALLKDYGFSGHLIIEREIPDGKTEQEIAKTLKKLKAIL